MAYYPGIYGALPIGATVQAPIVGYSGATVQAPIVTAGSAAPLAPVIPTYSSFYPTAYPSTYSYPYYGGYGAYGGYTGYPAYPGYGYGGYGQQQVQQKQSILNKVEGATGLDIDRDGDVGRQGTTRATSSGSLGLGSHLIGQPTSYPLPYPQPALAIPAAYGYPQTYGSYGYPSYGSYGAYPSYGYPYGYRY